jgi:hypothetical protein
MGRATGKGIMKVIGAGFGRTGTLSLKTALEELGCGPCYHMMEVFDKPRHVALWQAAAEGRPIDWDDLFAGYNSAVDWPACSFYEQLIDLYPDAKVLLTVRDPEKWYESVGNTIYPSTQEAGDSPDRRAHLHMIKTLIWQRTFHGRFEDKQHALAIFEQHNREVTQRVPAERLLVYDVREGWEPLCRFLGVPVPKDTAFPRLNDTATFQRRVQERTQRAGDAS